MKREQIKAIFLANGFKEKDQGEGVMDLNPYVYTAAEALLAGPYHRFDRLVEWARQQDTQIAELWARVKNFELYEQRDIWFWQNEGGNFPESLACPVLIEAPALRTLIAAAPEVRDAHYQAELSKAIAEVRDDFEKRLERITGACKDAVLQAKNEGDDKVGDAVRGMGFTYSSMQATNCAGCGQRKHTPLRVDPMGGYVCLTCIDQRLEGLLAEESARECEKDWEGCQEVADLPAVNEALKAFSADSTGGNGVEVVRAVVAALGAPSFTLPPLDKELADILGRPNFRCAHIANALRSDGADIPRKSEMEQAAVIYWMFGLYLKHGSGWMNEANAELGRMNQKAEESKKG